jgi:hypothetical protein
LIARSNLQDRSGSRELSQSRSDILRVLQSFEQHNYSIFFVLRHQYDSCHKTSRRIGPFACTRKPQYTCRMTCLGTAAKVPVSMPDPGREPAQKRSQGSCATAMLMPALRCAIAIAGSRFHAAVLSYDLKTADRAPRKPKSRPLLARHHFERDIPGRQLAPTACWPESMPRDASVAGILALQLRSAREPPRSSMTWPIQGNAESLRGRYPGA